MKKQEFALAMEISRMATPINRFLRQASRWILICLCSHFVTSLATAADQLPPPGEQLRMSVFPGKGHADTNALQKLTEDQRSTLTNYLREIIRQKERNGYGTINTDGSSEALDLAVLDDEEGKTRVVREYLRDPNFNSEKLRLVKNAKIISMIGEELFKEDPPFRVDVDIQLVASQEWARRNILYLIQRSGEFDDSVRGWAHRMDGERVVDPQGTRIMRDWYRQNEAALKASDFSKVRPGAEPPQKVANANVNNPNAVIASTNAASHAPLPIPVNGPATIQVSHNGNAAKWIIGGAVVLIALGGVLLATRRQKRPPG